MKKVTLLLVISLLVFGGLAQTAEELRVPLSAVKSSCYGEIDMTKAEFPLSEVGAECVSEDWLEKNQPAPQDSQSTETKLPAWEQTSGPPGGYINDIAINPLEPKVMYAAGSREGIYRTKDGGNNWELLPFSEPRQAQKVILNPDSPNILYSDYYNISKSVDGGRTWKSIDGDFGDIAYTQSLIMDPKNSDILYAGGRKHDQSGCKVFKTSNGGDTWRDITHNLSSPRGCDVSALATQGNGKLYVAINDVNFQSWKKGKVFYTKNDGKSWNEVDYGQDEDKFIWSIFTNPYKPREIWITEGPLHNEVIPQPVIYLSKDRGSSWEPVTVRGVGFDSSQVRVVGSSPDGKVYISAGSHISVTENQGKSFSDVTPPRNEMQFTDFRDITVHPNDSEVLYLPLRGSGIAYSGDGGSSWNLRNKGIVATNINLLETSPVDPDVVYAASTGGEGVFRSEDRGESWTPINNGIVHPYGDELTVNPNKPSNLWFITDVPFIHKSTNRGGDWSVLNNPHEGGNFNFVSTYAIGHSSDSDTIYMLDNGFGIFKGKRIGKDDWDWRFLRESEIDYTYDIAVHPSDSDVVFSGYIPKPFQDSAMIRRTVDGGNSWNTVLSVPESEGVTSVEIDPTNTDTVYAGSIGKPGEIFKSKDGGNQWSKLNEDFIMLTVWGQPQLVTDPDNPSTAYAATWLGGTWKTTNAGEDWKLLENAPISATALSLSDSGDVIYLADRTSPKIWKSTDGGETWNDVADFSGDRAFLVNRVFVYDNTVYASTFGPGLHGGKLYKSTDSGASWDDITGGLPRSVLDIAVDPTSPDIIYVTTHIFGAYKSLDGGKTWKELQGFPDIGGYDIEIDPDEPGTLFAAGMGGCTVPDWCMRPNGYTFTDGSGIYRSTDSGSTWNKVLSTSNESRAVRLHPDNHNIVFAAAMDDGLQVSTDGGDSWRTYNAGLDTTVLTSCAVRDDKIYVGTQGFGVYSGNIERNNWSITWQPNRSNKPIPTVYNLQIEVDKTDPSRIFVGSNPGGLYRSDDGGETFYDKNFLTPSVDVSDPHRQGYYTYALNPNDPKEVWLGTWGKGIFKSYDGMNFNITASGKSMKMYGKHVNDIAVGKDGSVYAGTEEGFYRTSDDGRTWRAINQGLPTNDVRTISINSSGEVYAGTRGYGLYRLSDELWIPQVARGQFGVIWPIWDDRPLYQYTEILFHPKDRSKVLIGTFPAGIYKSVDGGSTWQESNVGWTFDGVFSLITHPENPNIVYAGTYNGVNRSDDFGEHWRMWDQGMPPEQWVFSIVFDPRNPDVMYACSKNGENEGTGVEGFRGTVMKSVNGGKTWFEITKGLDINQEFYKLIIDPENPDTLYLAAQHDAMYISTNAGESWSLWNDGLENHIPGTNGNNVTDTLVLSADNSTLYLGTAGAGVFRREIRKISKTN